MSYSVRNKLDHYAELFVNYVSEHIRRIINIRTGLSGSVFAEFDGSDDVIREHLPKDVRAIYVMINLFADHDVIFV